MGLWAILRDVAADIRPMLEHFCRVVYTADYPPEDPLGKIVIGVRLNLKDSLHDFGGSSRAL
jgi:hypothetical protein